MRGTARVSRGTCGGSAAGGFTLVELMVALGLAAMIAVSIMVISNQAQEVYEVTSRKVDVYNKFRFALLSIEKDFSQWISTSNLEYFIDGRGGRPVNEHWDDGEQLPDTSDDRGLGVLDGGIRGTYDEFASITERHYAELLENGTRKIHDAFQAYLRTMTYVDGRTREALVEYMLLDPNRVDPRGNPLPPTEVPTNRLRDLTLFKVIRFNDISYDQIQKPSANFPIKRRYVEVCTNITDFKVEYVAENRFDQQKGATGFYTPLADFNNPPEADIQPVREASDGDVYRKLFGYGTGDVKFRGTPATGYRAIFGDRGGARQDHRPFRFGFERNPRNRFAELTPGDKIFAYSEGRRGGGGGGAGGVGAGVAGKVSAGAAMPSGTYTVKTNIGGRLEFIEPIESSTWGRDVPRTYYKASYLPQAVRITIRVIDETRGEEARTLQRVVWVRQKAR